MMKSAFAKYLKQFEVKPDKKISLKKDFLTNYDHEQITKEEGENLLKEDIQSLIKLQDKLYAEKKYSVLIVLQAMDAAGKDGAIKHVMSGLNPQGVKVTSFKAPTGAELEHDYFWRHYKALPAQGEIGIFNRSHYENVLVTKVHPEYVLKDLPGFGSIKNIDKEFWEERYKQINRFEKNLTENGTIILKFFLHLSKEEQKKRFLQRIEDASKNWKFSLADVAERKHWDQYMKAYEEMLNHTSTDHAPWFILPADDKWFTRLCLGSILHREFEKLNLKYPKVSTAQHEQLLKVKEALLHD